MLHCELSLLCCHHHMCMRSTDSRCGCGWWTTPPTHVLGEQHLEVYVCTHYAVMSEKDRQEIRNQMEEYEERNVNCFLNAIIFMELYDL